MNNVCCEPEGDVLPLVIIGAGAVGIEAALYARQLGYEPLLLEAGDSVAQTFRRLGSQRLYPDAAQLCTPLGLAWVPEVAHYTHFSAQRYAQAYLQPLVERSGLRVRLAHKVTQIGRRGATKPVLELNLRKKSPFKLVVTTPQGDKTLFAHTLIDATGSYSKPLPLGEGRTPAINEARMAKWIEYGVVDFEAQFERFNGRKTLLFGDCYAAFCSFKQFADLIERWHPDTRLICIKESPTEPFYQGFIDDLFCERASTYQRIQKDYHSSQLIEFKTQTQVLALDYQPTANQAWLCRVCDSAQTFDMSADFVVSNYGYQADSQLWQNLQVHQCYASGAPINYAAAMLKDVREGRVLKQAMPPSSLKNPEPNFYVIGAKSYGNTPGFYTRIGLGQIVALFQLVTQQSDLNLYGDFVAGLVQSDAPLQSTAFIKLSDAEQKYKTITEHLKEVVFQTDLNQRITYLSESWQKLTGKNPQDYLGLIWQDLLFEDSAGAGLAQCNAFMSCNLADYKEEFQVECADGQRKWVEVNAALLRDKNGTAYGTIGSMLDITPRVEVNAKLNALKERYHHMAYHDSLTGIANRQKLNEVLAHNFALFQRYQIPFSLILFDIDHFKKFNDQFGHLVGDEVLVKLAKTIAASVRNTDIFGRWGGEEFLVVVVNNPLDEGRQLAEKLRRIVASTCLVDQAKVTISAGVAMAQPNETLDQLINRADGLLYQAKTAGRDRVCT
ncbi:diguanylate cyclase [Thiomicrospira microaerophila]|uniref:diguanylate cyclase n=1 Tax=Thiomicrospira microaerophila TaxID=406020 RepID=UPI000698C08F|nr:diguanylate cyclase [Thiomicrospira microaerophila]